MTPQEKAQALIDSVTNALKAGTKHYDIHGKPLTTVKEVIEALNRDGQVELEPAKN